MVRGDIDTRHVELGEGVDIQTLGIHWDRHGGYTGEAERRPGRGVAVRFDSNARTRGEARARAEVERLLGAARDDEGVAIHREAPVRAEPPRQG